MGVPGFTDELTVNGIYNSLTMSNVTFVSLGYNFDSLAFGEFVLKGSYASLNETHEEIGDKVGHKADGRGLGFELNAEYRYSLGKDVGLLGEVGVLFPGSAWKSYTPNPEISYAARMTLDFKL